MSDSIAVTGTPFINYVLLFVFDDAAENVLLIKKTHGPEILHGKWNGLGGKIRDRQDTQLGIAPESFNQAATREFGEECGLYVKPEDWKYVLQLCGPDYQVHVLTARFENIENAVKMEDEEVQVHSVTDVLEQPNENFCRNVPWMVLLSLDETTTSVTATSIN